jgi:hypothetical protein
MGLEHSHGGAHRRFGGVRGRLVEHRVRDVAQRGKGFVQDACGAHARIGDDQRLAHANALALGAQERDGAKVQVDLGDVVDKGHKFLVPPGP